MWFSNFNLGLYKLPVENVASPSIKPNIQSSVILINSGLYGLIFIIVFKLLNLDNPSYVKWDLL